MSAEMLRIRDALAFEHYDVVTLGGGSSSSSSGQLRVELPNYLDVSGDDVVAISEWEDNFVLIADDQMRELGRFMCKNAKPKGVCFESKVPSCSKVYVADGWTVTLMDVETGQSIAEHSSSAAVRFWGMSVVEGERSEFVCACAPSEGLVALFDKSLEKFVGSWHYGKGVALFSPIEDEEFGSDISKRILPYGIARNGKIIASTDEGCGLVIQPDCRVWTSIQLANSTKDIAPLADRKASAGPNTKVFYQIGTKFKGDHNKNAGYAAYDIVCDAIGTLTFTDSTKSRISILRHATEYNKRLQSLQLPKTSQPIGISLMTNSDIVFTDHSKAGLNFIKTTRLTNEK